jgi:hypothetical protein
MLPLLTSAEMVKPMRVTHSFALLYVVPKDGGPRELLMQREPLVVHVWRLESHGRRWLPVFEATTDTRHCLATPPPYPRVGSNPSHRPSHRPSHLPPHHQRIHAVARTRNTRCD